MRPARIPVSAAGPVVSKTRSASLPSVTSAPAQRASCTAKWPTPPRAPVTITRSPRCRAPWSKSACHALRPARGMAALWTWSSVFGFDARAAAGTTAYSAAPPPRSKGVSANTSAPTAGPVAPGPRAATVPEISYDGIAGSRSSGHVSSSRVIAAAWTRISASAGPGVGSPICAISSWFGAVSRAASMPFPPLAAASTDRAVRQPPPRPRPKVRREHTPALHRQVWREGAIHPQARAENVVDHPVTLVEIQHRDVRLASDRQAPQPRLLADGLRRIRRRHRHHLRQREAEAEEARHDLGHAVHGVEPAGHRQIRADAVRHQALLDAAAPHVEAEVHAAVRGVEPHAAIDRLARLRHQLAVAVQHPARVGREVVRENVARLQHREQGMDDLGVVALFR